MVTFLPQAQVRTPENLDLQGVGQLGDAVAGAVTNQTRQNDLAAVRDLVKGGASTEEIATQLTQSRDMTLSQLGLQTLQRERERKESMASAQAGRAQSQRNSDRAFNASQKNSDRAFGLQERRLSAQESESDRDFKLKKMQVVADKIGNYAMFVQGIPNASDRAAKWQSFLRETAPDGAELPDELMDPINGPQLAIAEAGKLRKQKPMSVTEKKAIFEAEDEVNNLGSTVQTLDKALELNSKTFDGFGASMGANVGAKLPGFLVPDDIEAASNATLEWEKIMSMEAIKNMAQTLKGVTTDFELRKFEDVLADPSTPKEIRERTLRRMQNLAAKKKKTLEGRMSELRSGTFFNPRDAQEDTQNDPPKRLKFNPETGELE